MIREDEIAELLKTPEGRKILDAMLNESPVEQLSEVPPEPALESIDASPYGNAGGVDPNMPLGVDPNMPLGADPNMPLGVDPGADPNMPLGVDPNMPPPTLPQDVDPNMPQMQGANMTPEEDERRRMIAQLMGGGGGFRGVG